MRKISKIIVHCSATTAGVDFRAKDIDRWHKERGFRCIGYHYVVDLDGTIEIGRPESAMGAHCRGHNKGSIGVCYIGGINAACEPCDTRTDAQKEALRFLIGRLRERYPKARVYGHHDLNHFKDCPCFDAMTEYN